MPAFELSRFEWSTALEAGLVAIALLVFAVGAYWHGQVVNTDQARGDQGAYMAYAKGVAEQPFEYVGGRNRMPVYPYLQALVYQDGMEDETFFERGKVFSIFLSSLLLVGLYLLFRVDLSPIASLVMWSITTFTVFMFKAAYVQPELLFYSLFFLGFYLLVRLFRRPAWWHSALAGAVLGVAHLTKAAVLPALLLFIGFYALAALHRAYRGLVEDREFGEELLRRAGHLAAVVVFFLGVTSPYLITSKEVFGRYFYNVNSTFYMWYDSWDEVVEGTRAHGDRVGWPDMPEEEIPGPIKYLKEHSGYEILDRIREGLKRVAYRTTHMSFGWFKYAAFYLVLVGGVGAVRLRRTAKMFHEQPVASLFVAALGGSYLILWAWYVPIAVGNRFMLTLFLPFMWCLFRVLSDDRFRSPVLTLRGREVPWRAAVHLTVGFALLVDLVFFLRPRLMEMYAGG